jgi:hypothetical protein
MQEWLACCWPTRTLSFEAVDKRFNSVDKRFDDMRDLWRTELHRVEEVLDARLKHLEERGGSYEPSHPMISSRASAH